MGKLERWAVVAEIGAAVAVVASLVHLSFEVQRNTSAVQSQTSQGLLELSNEAVKLFCHVLVTSPVTESIRETGSLSLPPTSLGG